MSKRFFLLLCATFLGCLPAFSQNKTVSGKVTSVDEGTPLPGVNVTVQGTTSGTVTDVDGNFTINVEGDNVSLNFTFVGYKTQTIPVGTQSAINVALESDVTLLEDVVVIGYGTVKKSDLTGAVSSVRGSDLTKIPSISPEQALQGKVAGVQVTSSTGAPGALPAVRIRGVGTFNGASPIYVVDGVILNDISFLNSGDIQSMEVLKDASATAMYGSRGANGVIMITTKQGKLGTETPTINFLAEYSMQTLQKKIDLLSGSEFATIVNEITPGTYNNVNAVPNTNWQDEIFRNAPIHNYQVSASGASSKIQYYFGAGYFNQEGIIPKSNYERITIRMNNVYNLSSHIRLGNNLTLAPFRQNNANGNVVFTSYRAWPTISPYTATGAYSEVRGVGNPLADIEYTNNVNKGLRTVGNVYGEASFLKNFTFRTSFGVDMNYTKIQNFTPQFYVSPQQQASYSTLTKEYNDRLSWLWENTLNYHKEIEEKHKFDVVAGFTMQESSAENLKLQARNILRDGSDFWYFNGTNLYPNETTNEADPNQSFSMISYLFRFNYTFNDRYLFTATFRRDGSSKFTSANQYANFPSFGLGWNVINEEFMQTQTLFSNLKVRASWGIVGNEKIAYDQQYSRVENNLGAVFGTAEALYPGATYGKIGNPGLKWESAYQTDIGIEASFLNDQLTAEVDYFHKVTKDILIGLPVPGYLGNGIGALVTYNAAEVLNRGVEASLGWNSTIGDNIKYNIHANYTALHNEALKVMANGSTGDYLRNTDVTTSTAPGLPLGSFYGYKVDGIFQNAADLAAYPHRGDAGVGDVRYVDVSGDNEITDADRTNLGSPIPKGFYGFGGEISYKGFVLSADFQGQHGNKILNYKESVRSDLYNFEQHVMDRWRGEGTSNTEPRPTQGGYNYLISSRFIQDASFFRLRSLTVGYDLPAEIAGRMKMKSARLYLRGTNIFTATKYTGYTPEITSVDPKNPATESLNAGIDRGSYPIPSVYSVGLNVTF